MIRQDGAAVNGRNSGEAGSRRRQGGIGSGTIASRIYGSDIAIFRPGITSKSDIFVVSLENTLIVKRVYWDLSGQAVIL
jgi:phosphomevalonate kinase